MNEQNSIIIGITSPLVEELGTKWPSLDKTQYVILPETYELSRKHKLKTFLVNLFNRPSTSIFSDSQHKKSKKGFLQNQLFNSEIHKASALIIDWRWGLELANVIDAMPMLRWIHVVKTGVNHLPLDIIHKRGIMLTCVKGVYAQAVAEFTIGLIYCRLKRYIEHDHRMRQNRWVSLWSQGLAGKKLLILGTGAIGQRLATIASANGLIVTGVNSDGRPIKGFIRVKSSNTMAELWVEADVVVNCLPSTPATQGMVGNKEFSLLKRGTIFINVGREDTVDSKALLSGLDAGKPEWAALDIDPPLPNHPYRNHSQILLTHHSAYTSEDAKASRAKATVDNIKAFLAGKELSGLVDLERGY